MNIMEKMAKRISELKNPTVAGLDTRFEYLPESFINEIMPEGIKSFEDAAEWVDYNTIRALPYMGEDAPIVMNRLEGVSILVEKED